MDWEKKFMESRQPAVKLEIAMERLMEPEDLSGQWEQVYEKYLSERVCPALMSLVRQGKPEKLRRFLAWGIASREQCVRVLMESSVKNPEIRLLLMGFDRETENTPENGILTMEDAARQAWELAGASLAWEIAYLGLFFSEFQISQAPGHLYTGTDGLNIYLQPRQVVECFQKKNLRELYLHMMAHVLYGHVLSSKKYSRKLWDISCDISAWKLRQNVFGLSVDDRKEQEALAALEELFLPSIQLEQAVQVCEYLIDKPQKLEQAHGLLENFPRDDHDYWYGPQDSFGQNCAFGGEGGCGDGTWAGQRQRAVYLERIKKKLAAAKIYREKLEASLRPRRRGQTPGSRYELLRLREEGKYDFHRYLERFASVREELQTDEDSFDYGYYMLGLARYGNMPLIEPLEYMEARRVEELVIAIDTSGSCSVEVVRRFLEETRNLLTRKENFFRKMNVHIIQCDSMIQQHQVITSVEDWQRYERKLTVEGRGGTDFTPVFSYVEKLRDQGKLKNLKGLLYFTDGDGVYPRVPTDYETIFVFTDREFLEGDTAREIPAWAVRLCLDIPKEGKQP